MPVVPTYERQVSATNLPTVRSNVSTTPETFGAGIGRAMQGVGNQAVDFALEEQQRQDMAALMSAERQLQQWQNQALFTPDTGAFSQRGQNAFGLPDKLLPEWDKKVGEVESTLSERQRQKFRERAGGMRVSMERDLMRHVGSEAESFQKTETNALVTTRLETAMLYWKDPARFDKEMREAQGVFMAGNPGLPPAAVALGVAEIESKARANVVQKMLEEDPLGAQRYFDTYADKMSQADRAQVERVLKPARLDAEADQEVARAMGRGVEAVPPPADFRTYMRKLESGGRADAKNPKSSATGADQFIESTWMSLVNKAKPAWAAGKSRAEILAMRTDPDKSAQMADMLASENANVLTRAGVPVTNESLYAAHHFGSDSAVKFAKAEAGTPIEKILSADQIAANDYLRGKTKAEVIENWNRRAGATAGQEPLSTPVSKADVMQRLGDIEDPQLRKAALAKYAVQLEIDRVREDEAEKAFTESINEKVESADPTAQLRNVLTPQEYAWATEKGKIASWEARMSQRLQGLEPKTDPALFDALQSTLIKAENGDATALSEVKKMDVSRMFTGLDKQARDYIQNRRSNILGEKGGKDEKPDFASEDELLNVEVFDKLGISKNPQKEESEENKATRVAFMQSYWAAVEQAQTEKKGKLTSAEKQTIMREQMLPFARTVRDRFLGLIPTGSTETKRGFEIGAVPVLDRQQIVAAYVRVHGVSPTDAEVRATYLRAQGYKPQLETE